MIDGDIEIAIAERETWLAGIEEAMRIEREDADNPGMPEFDLDEGEPEPEPWSDYWLDLGGEA